MFGLVDDNLTIVVQTSGVEKKVKNSRTLTYSTHHSLTLLTLTHTLTDAQHVAKEDTGPVNIRAKH